MNFARLIPLYCLLTVLTNASLAQDDTEAEESPPATSSTNPIEEIIVTPQESFLLLRNQLEFTQEQFYSAYNEVNVDDEYDVDCGPSDWTGTHIKQFECWPEFFQRIVADNAQDSFANRDINYTVEQLMERNQAQFDALRSNILKVANENPKVAAWLLELGRIQQEIESRREECERDPAFRFLFFRLCRI